MATMQELARRIIPSLQDLYWTAEDIRAENARGFTIDLPRARGSWLRCTDVHFSETALREIIANVEAAS